LLTLLFLFHTTERPDVKHNIPEARRRARAAANARLEERDYEISDMYVAFSAAADLLSYEGTAYGNAIADLPPEEDLHFAVASLWLGTL
jgi:hypothetical protein